MSRIGNKKIHVPSTVTVTNVNNFVTVKGPKGQLEAQFNKDIEIKQEGTEITVSRKNDSIVQRQNHGTTRALLFNMVEGVVNGFEKKLEIVGVGYRANLQGNKIVLSLGFSHPVEIQIPQGLQVEVPKPTEINIKGISKELVGEFAANVRALKLPEPYKGKGIKYVGEHIRRKAGKTAK